ncbi:hypothetical protein V8D89_002353 [Ganoderma adspersum]
MEIDKLERSTARLALAHRTKVAKQRDATTFLWLYDKLIACLNCDTICHDSAHLMTAEMLFGFIRRRCRDLPDGYRLAMAPVALEPRNTCQPMWPPCGPEVGGSARVTPGDYILYFKDPQGYTIYKPTKSWHVSRLFSSFDSIQHVGSFSERGRIIPPTKIRDDLKTEALLLSHNRGPCVVTGTQGTEGEDPTTEVRWIYPPSMSISDICPTHCPELSEYENWDEEGKFEVPHNLIMMRKDVYDLFQNHAFGIDLDASPQGEIYVFHSSETVKKKILYSSLAIEVKDEMSQAFLREHFHQCLMSGIIGQDIGDQTESNTNTISLMLDMLPEGALPKAAEWPQDEGWDTEIGEALKEWLRCAERENEDWD